MFEKIKFMIDYYNIHNLLNIRVEKCNVGLFHDVEYEYSFFKSEVPLENVDLSIRIGEFHPSLEDCKLVNREFYVKKDYIFYQKKQTGYSWKVEIRNLTRQSIEVKYFVKYSGFRSLFPIFASQNIFMRSLLFISLLKKGYLLMHSSAVSDGNKASIFMGEAGVYKTTLAIKMMNDYGYGFLGEENVIIGKGKCYPYPFNYQSFSYKKDFWGFEKAKNKIQRLKLILHLLLNRHNNLRLSSQSYELENLFYLKREMNQKKVTISPASKKAMVNFGLINELEEISSCPTHALSGIPYNSFIDIINVYLYSHDLKRTELIWPTVNSILKENIDKINNYVLIEPMHFSEDLPMAINNLIKSK